MHTILHLQPDGPYTKDHKSLKQGLGQPRPGSFLTHHNRAQLTVISDQDQLKNQKKISIYRTLVKSAYQQLIFLFLNQNICCGYSKGSSQ